MKRKFVIPAFLGLFLIASCTKKTTPTPTPTPSPATSGFTWSENGGTEIKADSAYYEKAYKTIKAYKSGKFIEINLTDGIPAVYTVNTSNAISMLIGSNLYIASTGNVTISSNASSKMSGTFTSKGSGASLTMLDGKFTDIAVR